MDMEIGGYKTVGSEPRKLKKYDWEVCESRNDVRNLLNVHQEWNVVSIAYNPTGSFSGWTIFYYTEETD